MIVVRGHTWPRREREAISSSPAPRHNALGSAALRQRGRHIAESDAVTPTSMQQHETAAGSSGGGFDPIEVQAGLQWSAGIIAAVDPDA